MSLATCLRRRCTLPVAALAVSFVVTLPPRAWADDDAARAYFKQGIEHYDHKDYAKALESFRAAYREKPSAGIKQNIALSLKGLGRPVEAAQAFDEALDEGQGTLKPETKAAIERELAEITRSIGTVFLKVVGEDMKPVDAVVSVDGVELPPGAARRPLRMAQGIHTIDARVEGFPPPPQKKLALVAGSPVDATFIVTRKVAVGDGTLTIRASTETAKIRLDGADVGTGTFTGTVRSGNHQVEVSDEGWATTNVDVAVPAGGTVDYPVTLRKPSEAPGAYAYAERPPPPKEKRGYIVPMIMIDGNTLRLSAAAGGDPDGKTRGFAGGGIGLRGGVKFGRFFGLELYADWGQQKKKYATPGEALETETTFSHWQLTPMARFTTAGSVRFTTGTGFGVHGAALEVKLPERGNVQTRSGKGVSASWLLDAGMQFDLGPVYLEGAFFIDVFGVGSVRSDGPTDDRLLLSSPVARYGGRAGLGIRF